MAERFLQAGALTQAAELSDTVAAEIEATDPEAALRLELDFLTGARSTPDTFPLVPPRLPRVVSRAGTTSPTARLALVWLA